MVVLGQSKHGSICVKRHAMFCREVAFERLKSASVEEADHTVVGHGFLIGTTGFGCSAIDAGTAGAVAV